MSVKLIAPDILENPNYEKPYIYDFKGLVSLPNQSDWWHIVYIPHIYNGPESGGYGYQIATKLAQDAKMFIRGAYGGIWGNWKQVAGAEPPQEFKLETAAGYKTYHGYKNQYSMNGFGEVTVIGCICRNDESVFPEMSAEDNTIAVLPQGYRPNEWLSVGGVLRFPTVEPKPCLVFIKNTGEISALIGAGMANQYKVIEFHVTYVATK